MNNKCTCGGRISSFATTRECEETYKDLLMCIDCNKKYSLISGGVSPISNTEFRKIVTKRVSAAKSCGK